MTTTPESRDSRRSWRGVGPDERQARRREQLVDAGFAIMGTEGAAAVTMRGVSRAAKLTERYFYESFANREELLVAVLENVATQSRTSLLDSLAEAPTDIGGLIRQVVGTFTEFVTADPRRGRVIFVESLSVIADAIARRPGAPSPPPRGSRGRCCAGSSTSSPTPTSRPTEGCTRSSATLKAATPDLTDLRSRTKSTSSPRTRRKRTPVGATGPHY